MPGDESEYEVLLFKEQGFRRKRCPKCKRFFWTLGDGETCGEPPCNEYSFIKNPPTRKKLNLHEMREVYLRFFEKNSHTRVNRYPIVARWRDDVFFTQASIYCFQPWVLLGVVKPPANPLTISQTCVRFNDIDNVGKTGRHFTMFEMMAHHSFNTRDNPVYFKDETVKLCHRLLTEDLRINPEEISYIEAQWAGGGNAGPCFETLVGGVELATLVFMMYKEVNGKRVEMDMQVVDTGYGLERFTWLSQGTSSAYEAVFGDVLSRLKKEAGILGDERILSEYSKVAGLMSVESNIDLKILRKTAAERLGITPEKLHREIGPMENLYTICDHTRALMFMLQDGVVPSNVKEGYFARLLVRRTLRALNTLKLNIPLSEIIRSQIDYFQGDFPELKEGGEEITKLVDVEVEKYNKTLKKGRGIVERMEDRSKEIDLENLIELYDSQGLTPDLVQEFTSLKVKIPDDFYIRVVKRHEKPEVEKEGVKEVEIPKGVSATRPGYYTDSSVRRFKAKVLAVHNDYVILDKTFFYPEGGGQETDHGRISGLGVYDVQKTGNVIIHKAKGDLSRIKTGDVADCEIDWERRIQLMQHHTATHIVNGAARKVLGNHIWQTGAHKSVKGARLDISHYAALNPEELREIESLANKIVKENREIDIRVMKRDEAENKYGFRLYQGGVVPGGMIRVVNIRDWDVEACGGMHFDNTGDVGAIRITGSKRIQDGVVRLEFTAGNAALEYGNKEKELYEKICESLSEGMKPALDREEIENAAAILSVKIEKLPETLKRFLDECVDMEEEIRGLSGAVEKPIKDQKVEGIENTVRQVFNRWKECKKILENLKKTRGDVLREELKEMFRKDYVVVDDVKMVKKITKNLDMKTLIETAKDSVSKRNQLLILLNTAGDKVNVIVASNSRFHAGKLAKNLSQRLGGGAHGDARLGMGGGLSSDAEKILREFKP